MKFSKYTLITLFLVVLASLGILLNNQFKILEKDIEANENMMRLAVPGILSNFFDNMMYDQDLRRMAEGFRGTKDFSFTNDEELSDPLQQFLKTEINKVVDLNYPQMNYRLDGFISSEYGCMIHRNHRPELPKAQNVLNADNHLCFCLRLNNTLDIAMTYTNKEEAALNESGAIIRNSFLLILVILLAFAYTIYTINKQKKLSDLKRDFINNLTHEFKTPIFSISLAAKTLKEKEEVRASEKMSSYVDLIGAETKRLQSQVDKILQMALLDSGNLHLDKKQFDLHEAIRQVTDSFTMIIAEKKGEIQLRLDAQKFWVNADEIHIKNILYNLIDNAQKYSQAAPQIEILTLNNQKGILVKVKDHGIGMDPKIQQHIFDPFYRAETGNVHTVKGFGLGLSYVKRIVEFHKGSVTLTSKQGHGSEFTIFLPQTS